MIKAVIVDFDDTLCLTEEACYNMENEALKRMGRPPMDRELYDRTWGQPAFEAIKVRSPGVDVDTYRKVHALTHTEWILARKIDAVPEENLRVLDMLLDVGKEVFILTSRTHAELKHLLEPDHDLAQRVKAFYYKDITLYHKPDPRVFQKLLEEHRLKPEECIYVGDSPSDAAAAKGAGMHFVACLEAVIRTKKDFLKERVEYFIDRFKDLDKAVADIEKA